MRVSVRLVALVAVLALAAAACGNSGDDDTTADTGADATDAGDGDGDRDTFVPVDAPGVTDTEIQVVSVATGPSANPLGTNIKDAFNDGIEARFAYENSEGGIYGRELVLANERDDNLMQNTQEVQAAISQDDPFAVFIASLNANGTDVAQENGVPAFGWNLGNFFSDRPAVFGSEGAICEGCPGRTVPYLAQQEGATKIGVLGYGVSESSKICAEGNREMFEQYLPEAEVVFFDNNLPYGLTGGVAPQVTEMKKQDVDFIATCMDLNGMKVLAEELRKQDHPVTMYHPNTYNQAFVAQNAELFEGDYVVPRFLAFESPAQPEAGELFNEWVAEIGAEPEELTMTGWIVADMLVRGLLEAGPEFGQQGVVDALNQVTDFSAGGLIEPIDWTYQHDDPTDDPSVRSPLECFNAVQVRDGEFVVPEFHDAEEPWLCWDIDAEGLPEPESYAFD